LSRSDDKNVAFVELLLPLQRSLEVYCRRMLRDPSHVEDVLQTAIMEAFVRFDRYAEGTNFRAWMFRFLTLEIFNRNRKREPAPFGDGLDDFPGPPAHDWPEDALSLVLENPGPLLEHFEDRVVEALWQLTTAERAVLLLRAVGEFSYHEIHTILAIPLGSVIGYLSRSRRKMRQALADYAAQRGLHRTEGPQP
jgi:RNA polymerase sigma-70 factor (ECF subfamily)